MVTIEDLQSFEERMAQKIDEANAIVFDLKADTTEIKADIYNIKSDITNMKISTFTQNRTTFVNEMNQARKYENEIVELKARVLALEQMLKLK